MACLNPKVGLESAIKVFVIVLLCTCSSIYVASFFLDLNRDNARKQYRERISRNVGDNRSRIEKLESDVRQLKAKIDGQ